LSPVHPDLASWDHRRPGVFLRCFRRLRMFGGRVKQILRDAVRRKGLQGDVERDRSRE
jgi:hypothetical protein